MFLLEKLHGGASWWQSDCVTGHVRLQGDSVRALFPAGNADGYVGVISHTATALTLVKRSRAKRSAAVSSFFGTTFFNPLEGTWNTLSDVLLCNAM